jgi:hypothetical protein
MGLKPLDDAVIERFQTHEKSPYAVFTASSGGVCFDWAKR